MNPVILAYLPPPSVTGAEQFLANLRAYKTKHPLVLYSDWDYGPEVKRIKASPEIVLGAKYSDGRDNKWALNNLVFLTGLKIIADMGCSHVLYVEADCRVHGDYWDAIIFEEYAFRGNGAIAAGTIAAYNVCNRNIAFSRAWNTFVAENIKCQFPITSYGGNGAAESHEPAIFPNGALAIYDLDWLSKQYGRENTVAIARELTAFDYDIGRRLVRQFGNDVFRKVCQMNSVYSSYGDVQTSEGERQEMLTDRRVAAVHQIKSTWAGPISPLVAEELAGNETIAERDLTVSEEARSQDVSKPPMVGAAMPSAGNPNVEIFIVSYAPDIPYLEYNLRSINKFCEGFSGTTVLVPEQDRKEFERLLLYTAKPFTLKTYKVPKDKKKWHIAHQLQKMYADQWCPDADYILHTDSDCVFTKPTTPADYFRDGKPILCIEPFDRIGNNPWKPVIDAALNIDSKYETMRRHGAIHHKASYVEFRSEMKDLHGDLHKWWMSQKADYPWGVTEFNFIGNFVVTYPNHGYTFIDVSKELPPENHIFQFWSHKKPNEDQSFPGGGSGVPEDKLRELGLI